MAETAERTSVGSSKEWIIIMLLVAVIIVLFLLFQFGLLPALMK